MRGRFNRSAHAFGCLSHEPHHERSVDYSRLDCSVIMDTTSDLVGVSACKDHMSTRQYLKEQTATVHGLTEALFWSSDGFADKPSYIYFLAKMLKAHLRLGRPAAQSVGDRQTVAHEAALISALGKDLGCAALTPDTCRHMDSSFAWGVRYALDGSAIGAAFILKSPGFSPNWPHAYLAQAKAHLKTGGTKRCFEALNAATVDPDRAAEGARAVFQSLRHDDKLPLDAGARAG